MKNRMLTLAGALALFAVLGKFYTLPAIAQQVRAALTKNIDEPGRTPYLSTGDVFCLPGFHCKVNFATVPAGKRLVVEYLNVSVFHSDPQTPVRTGFLCASTSATCDYKFGPRATNPQQDFISEPVRLYFEPNTALSFGVQVDSTIVDTGELTASLSGYLVDLTQ